MLGMDTYPLTVFITFKVILTSLAVALGTRFCSRMPRPIGECMESRLQFIKTGLKK